MLRLSTSCSFDSCAEYGSSRSILGQTHRMGLLAKARIAPGAKSAVWSPKLQRLRPGRPKRPRFPAFLTPAKTLGVGYVGTARYACPGLALAASPGAIAWRCLALPLRHPQTVAGLVLAASPASCSNVFSILRTNLQPSWRSWRRSECRGWICFVLQTKNKQCHTHTHTHTLLSYYH